MHELSIHHNTKIQAVCNAYVEEEDDYIEESEWKISCHDVPHPVPTGMRTTDAGQVKGVSQGIPIVIRETPTTESSSSVPLITNIVVSCQCVVNPRNMIYTVKYTSSNNR